MVTSGFHLWQFQVFNSGAKGLVVVLFWLDLWEFSFGHTGVWTWDLWIASPALYHCTMVTSGFHLWQFQVFNSGAKGLVVVLFWLDLWEIFCLDTLGFEPGTSGSLVLHSITAPQWLLVLPSDNFRYLTLVQRDWWWYFSDWTCERFSFGHTGIWTQNLWISSPALYHCTMVTSGFYLWQFQVFNSGAEGLVVVLFWLDLWAIFFLATLGFESKTSGSLVLHSNNVSWWLLVFTSDNFRYLTLLQRDLWWYSSDWTCERFSFWPQLGFEPVTSGSLVLHSTTAPRWLLVFTSYNFRYFNSGTNGLVVVLFWLDLWEIFFLETL